MVCRSCGAQISDNSVVCPSCGCEIRRSANFANNNMNGQPNNVYTPPNNMYGQPNNMYVPPNNVYGPPNNMYGQPNNMYGPPNNVYTTPIINNVVNVGHMGAPKNKWVAFLLCFFFGWLGVHKFYEGKAGMGVLYFFTLGLFGIGCFIDLIVILCKPHIYYVY